LIRDRALARVNESIAPLAMTLIPSRTRTLKYVRKLNCLVALMLDIVDVFVWYPDTKGRRLHSFVVHAVIHSLDTEQDAHNYLNTQTFANNINLRSL
jgi:hypothetical protein